MSVSVPSSTWGSSASCWPLLKRWISSTNRTVAVPPRSIHSRARAMTARRSATPLMTADRVEYGASTWSAISRASVVLPTPGGPHRIIDTRVPRSSIRRSAPRSPMSASWPTTSARFAGRIRAASGACGRGTDDDGQGQGTGIAGGAGDGRASHECRRPGPRATSRVPSAGAVGRACDRACGRPTDTQRSPRRGRHERPAHPRTHTAAGVGPRGGLAPDDQPPWAGVQGAPRSRHRRCPGGLPDPQRRAPPDRLRDRRARGGRRQLPVPGRPGAGGEHRGLRRSHRGHRGAVRRQRREVRRRVGPRGRSRPRRGPSARPGGGRHTRSGGPRHPQRDLHRGHESPRGHRGGGPCRGARRAAHRRWHQRRRCGAVRDRRAGAWTWSRRGPRRAGWCRPVWP